VSSGQGDLRQGGIVVTVIYRDGTSDDVSSTASEEGAMNLIENDWRVRAVRFSTPYGPVCVEVEEVVYEC